MEPISLITVDTEARSTRYTAQPYTHCTLPDNASWPINPQNSTSWVPHQRSHSLLQLPFFRCCCCCSPPQPRPLPPQPQPPPPPPPPAQPRARDFRASRIAPGSCGSPRPLRRPRTRFSPGPPRTCGCARQPRGQGCLADAPVGTARSRTVRLNFTLHAHLCSLHTSCSASTHAR